MVTRFKSLKKQLKSLEEGTYSKPTKSRNKRGLAGIRGSSSGWLRYLLFGSFIIAFLLYAGARYNVNTQSLNPVTQFIEWVNQPDQDLLNEMGEMMEEMGYTGLSQEDLIDLRSEGVTATYTSRMRDLGYTDLTLEDLVRLQQNDVSATFSAMMRELGYELSIEDLIRLRQHNVTAYFTSNMHDLGYEDITMEELIRLKDTGVQTTEVRQLVEESESLPTIEELIRYRISNQ